MFSRREILLGSAAVVLAPSYGNALLPGQKAILLKSLSAYYVDGTNGSDNNSGRSPSAAWKTVSKVNASTFKPGDSVLFAGGQTWREELLPSSTGAPGKPITFGSYGVGKATISAADIVVSSWTQDVVSPLDYDDYEAGTINTTFWQSGTGGASDSVIFYAGAKSWKFIGAAAPTVSKNNLSAAFVEFSFALRIDSTGTATNAQNTRIVSVESPSWTGANGVMLWAKKSGSNWQIGGGRGSSPTATFTISADAWHLVRFQVSSNGGAGNDFAKLYIDGTLTQTISSLTLTGSATQIAYGIFGYNNAGFITNVDNFGVYNADSTATVNRWFTTVTTQPKTVYVNKNPGTLVANAVSVVSANQWYWTANTLYVYSVNSPATDYTTPGVEVGARNYTLEANNQSYVRLKNLIFEGGNASTTGGSILIPWVSAGPDGSGSNLGWQLDGVLSRFNSQSGCFFDSPGGSIVRSQFDYNGNIGLDVDSGFNMSVSDCSFTGNSFVNFFPGAIHGQITNLVASNLTINATGTQNGIEIDNASNVTIQNTTISGAIFNGIYVVGDTLGAQNIILINIATSGTTSGPGFHFNKNTAATVSVTLVNCSDTGSLSKSQTDGGASVTGTVS